MANPAGMSQLGWLSAGSALIQGIGMLEGGRAARIAGERQKAANQFEAWQAEREAGLSIALSQQRAREETRQSDMAASRALAVAAASGGGVSDPTIVRLLANVRGEGVYRANVALYEGEARARQLRLAGATGNLAGAEAVVEGVRRETGAMYSAMGAVGKAGLSLYEKYGGSGAPTNPAYGALDKFEIFSGAGMTDPRYGG